MSIKGIYDIHCHIVPGVDDGATDIGETVKLLRMEYEQGVRTVIATPHFRFRMFETPAEKVREQFRLVEKAASEISPDLHVYLGCEFHANMEMLPMLREQKVMTMAGSRYVLTEFSHNSEESYIRERLGALLSGGYKPIMAHIERYEATRNSLDFVEELADMGVYMQINADSITGKDGFFTKRYCNKIMISFLNYEKILEKDMYAWYEKTTHMCCAFFYDITQIFYIVLAGQEKQIIEADESVTQSIRKIQLFIRRHEDYWKDHVKQKIELEHRLEAML